MHVDPDTYLFGLISISLVVRYAYTHVVFLQSHRTLYHETIEAKRTSRIDALKRTPVCSIEEHHQGFSRRNCLLLGMREQHMRRK